MGEMVERVAKAIGMTQDKWKLVPVEPTEEMLAATKHYALENLYGRYRAMIESAPELPPAQDEMSATVRFWRSGTLSAQEAMIVVAGLLERSPPVFPLGVETGSAIEAPRAMSGLSHDAMKECVEALKALIAHTKAWERLTAEEAGHEPSLSDPLVDAIAALAKLEKANG